MFYFQTNTLGFTPEFLGKVRLAGALASLAGVGAYNFALKVKISSACSPARIKVFNNGEHALLQAELIC